MNTIKLLPGGASVEAYPGVPLTFRVVKPAGASETFTARVFDPAPGRLRELIAALWPVASEDGNTTEFIFSGTQTTAIARIGGAYVEIWYGDKVAFAGDLGFVKNSDARPSNVTVAVQVSVGDNIVSVPVTMLSGTGAPPAPVGAAFAPLQIAEGATFTVGDNQQVLFALPIDIEGDLEIEDGHLIEA